MTSANSPMYAQGSADGEADSAALSACPPGEAAGPRPPSPAYPVMYMRGYTEHFLPFPCQCDGKCRGESEERDEKEAQNVH